MKYKLIYLFILLSIEYNVFSQNIISNNLVPNPGFEEFSSCPYTFSQIKLAIPWDDTRGGNIGSTDYINICSSYTYIQYILFKNLPYKGNACAGLHPYGNNNIGLFTNYREYIEVKLKQKLIKNKHYCCKFFTVLSTYGAIATENIGILITKTYVNSFNPLAQGEMLIDSVPQIIKQNKEIEKNIDLLIKKIKIKKSLI
jgi:hypothetical protein